MSFFTQNMHQLFSLYVSSLKNGKDRNHVAFIVNRHAVGKAIRGFKDAMSKYFGENCLPSTSYILTIFKQ